MQCSSPRNIYRIFTHFIPFVAPFPSPPNAHIANETRNCYLPMINARITSKMALMTRLKSFN